MQSVVMVFSGEYDLAAQRPLRANLSRLVAAPSVILDFREVTYVDSTVISELIRMHRLRAEKRFERETIVGGSPQIRKLFDLLQLRKIFRLVDEMSEAIEGQSSSVTTMRYLPIERSSAAFVPDFA